MRSPIAISLIVVAGCAAGFGGLTIPRIAVAAATPGHVACKELMKNADGTWSTKGPIKLRLGSRETTFENYTFRRGSTINGVDPFDVIERACGGNPQ